MSLARSMVVVVASVLGMSVALPHEALAESVECPQCWRMIDDGPCRCPHCRTELPGRTCPPEEETRTPSAPADRPTKTRPPTSERRRPPRDRERPPRPPPPADTDAGRSSGARSFAETQGFDAEGEGERSAARDETEETRERDREVIRDDDIVDDLEDDFEDDFEDDYEDDELDDEEDERSTEERTSRRPLTPYRHGPALLLGYRYFGLYDWTGEGHSHALAIEGYPIRRFFPWLRFGLGLDVGFRQLERHTDWVMRGFVSLGVQYPRRVTPFASLNVGGGTVYRKRFGQGLTDGMFAIGFDVGATFGLSRTFVVDLSIGYLFFSYADLGYHSPSIRVSLGW